MTDNRIRPVPIVGIGASAGGIEAFRKFFEMMPAHSGLAFVVVLHLPANRKSLLPEILSRWTSMPIVEAADGCALEADTVYVPQAGSIVTFRDGKLHLHQPAKDEPPEPIPISVFFDSLAQALHEDAIGVILSGTGSDGALGLKAIKTCGGLTLAQGTDGSSPLHGGMPDSAIATGAVDIVASAEDMPRHIIAAQKVRRQEAELAGSSGLINDAERLAICAILTRDLGHDFAGYKDKTFMRRVQRRKQVVGLGETDAYIQRLERDRSEVLMLFRDLLIGVTSFFRDAETFETLRQIVVPRLFQGKSADSNVRVWVPGCATGEEAYSIAILLAEYAGQLPAPAPRIQVFATDIDEAAITTARAGRYPSALMSAISPAHLERFFVMSGDGAYTVKKQVRELCTFSAHSLTRDPPFSRIDLISCRNLLIYLDSDLQSAIIPAFHYALVPDGILLLGSAETVSRHETLFEALDRPHRIFRRRNTPSPPLQMHSRTLPRELQISSDAPAGSSPVRRGNLRSANRANARVLERFGPAFVVVGADGLIAQYSSRIGRFLEPPPGVPSQNAFDMARGGLRLHLRGALKQAVESGRSVELPHVPVSIPGEGHRHITLAVDPLFEQGASTLYLVVFLEAAQPSDRTDADGRAEPPGTIDQRLESELRDVREQLQAITEEHETALEELRSSNEELHSVNEELQSTNEELETSKEEIQSINEELQTVNTQLSVKLDELDRKNMDLKNLFESTEVATIFLDRFLIVRGFTPAVANIYNLIPSDQGRPLTDIVSRLRYTGVREDVQSVLNTLEPLERRVTRDDGSMHYLMRAQPYRTPDSTVDGAVMTFVDVTSIVKAEEHQRLLVDELNHRVKNMLTVVISLATQTLRRSPTLEAFSETFLGRIHALTAAYSLLSSESWQTVALRDILMEEFRPFLVGDGSNIVATGPRVLLEPRAALALGMAVHELTTNAIKYGALSVPEGKVRVDWSVETDPKGETLVLDWVETGGPTVGRPNGNGFGMLLIERGLKQDMSAEIKVEFPPTGVCARLRAPLYPQGIMAPETASA
ncbi:CheR family methyltransferase [Acidisoma sp.]|uniref:CheR family methyltransferase n=1 Tax=Acidisoma sp. TaxID=1872115 RepID=UPI003B00B083